jgi:hypothetical protein
MRCLGAFTGKENRPKQEKLNSVSAHQMLPGDDDDLKHFAQKQGIIQD